MCSTLVPSRGLCRIFVYRTRHTQCVARLFLRVAYVGSYLMNINEYNVILLRHALPINLLILRKKPTVLQSTKNYNAMNIHCVSDLCL